MSKNKEMTEFLKHLVLAYVKIPTHNLIYRKKIKITASSCSEKYNLL